MTIADLREKIDGLDRQLLTILNERAHLAGQIGEFKRKAGQPILDRNRETAVFERLKVLNEGPLTDDDIQTIFSAIIIACRDLQTKLK